MGMLMMGGWAQGVIKNLGGKLDDFMITAAPQDEGKPCFVLNADSLIFWKRKEADLQAGQQLLAKLMMQKDVQEHVLADHRLDPGAHRRRPVGCPAGRTASATPRPH